MHFLVDKLTNYCIRRNIIDENTRIWFEYGIEKRLSTIIVAIPFFLLALLLTNVSTAVAFYISFYWLRSRINGFHAKTVGQCFVVSLLAEFVYCCVLYNILFHWDMLIYITISFIIIFVYAPYNHPHMSLSSTDISLCRKHSRIRIICLSVVTIICLTSGCLDIAKGIVLGSSMAALMLIIPYIFHERSTLT